MKRYLCLERDVPKIGSFASLEIFGNHLLVGRTESQAGKEEIVVFPNLCRHRGHRILTQASGCLPVKCPYHGQTFIPKIKWQASQVGDFLFFCGEGDSDSFEETEIPKIDLGPEFGSYSQRVEAPFHLWMQNTADPNHVPFIHGSFFNIFEPGAPPYDVQFYNGKRCSSYRMPIRANVIDGYEQHLERTIFDPSFFHMLVYPHLSITSFLGLFFTVETALPISESACQVHTRFFSLRGLDPHAPLLEVVEMANIKILKEDRDICESWAKSYDPEFIPEYWLPGEERIRAYLECHEAWEEEL